MAMADELRRTYVQSGRRAAVFVRVRARGWSIRLGGCGCVWMGGIVCVWGGHMLLLGWVVAGLNPKP